MFQKENNKENRAYYIDALLLCCAFGFFVFMMLYNLLHSDLWGDEWMEYMISQKAIKNGEMYQAIITTFQPPLYNFLMHFWLKISSTVLWFRLFNVFIGTFTGVFIYRTVKRLTNFRLAVALLIILGATYQWVYCIQECSEYALMIMFISGAMYFYTRISETDGIWEEFLFILFCSCAMYSQYGAFFVICPMLIMHLIKKCFTKKRNNILRTFTMYLGALVVFAIPLYVFFARFQLKNNEIADNMGISLLSIEDFLNFPIVFGKLISYFFAIKGKSSIIAVILGILVILFGIYLLNKDIAWIKKSFVLMLFVSFILFYFLVVFHVYGMVHPDKSAGFYSRYAYFFIPLFAVVIPMIINEGVLSVEKASIRNGIARIVFCGILILLFISYPKVLNNWHKAYDRELAQIWVYNAGFKDVTYLLGFSKSGFDYYTNEYEYGAEGEVREGSIDLENLPDAFWLWRTNWGGNEWQETVDEAVRQGYEVMIYANHGYQGQLAYCIKQ